MIRLDGRTPDDGIDPPPPWATVDLLTEAIESAAKAVHLDVPGPYGDASRELCWGAIDVRRIETTGPDGSALSEAAVAGYVAKYATKAAETSGTWTGGSSALIFPGSNSAASPSTPPG